MLGFPRSIIPTIRPGILKGETVTIHILPAAPVYIQAIFPVVQMTDPFEILSIQVGESECLTRPLYSFQLTGGYSMGLSCPLGARIVLVVRRLDPESPSVVQRAYFRARNWLMSKRWIGSKIRGLFMAEGRTFGVMFMCEGSPEAEQDYHRRRMRFMDVTSNWPKAGDVDKVRQAIRASWKHTLPN